MAALYLHNAIHSPDYESSTLISPHRRNPSSFSNVTLQSTSEISHPTEPLLQSSTLESVAYLDLLSRQPSHPSGPRPAWTTGLSLDGDPISTTERKSSQEHFVRRRRRRLKHVKGLLELVIAVWAIYNTVRYFMAYTVYESMEGQAASLALGISTGVSFAFLSCAFILSIFQPYLVYHNVALLPILHARAVLHVLASFALFGPTVVNLVLLFVWKNSSILEINIRQRCHVDMDAIWSVSSKECKPPAWSIWIVLSVLRAVITLSVIISYHCIAMASYRLRRSSFSHSWRRGHSGGLASESYRSSLSPSMAAISRSSYITPQRNTLHSQHQSSESTLRSNPHSKHSSGHLPSHTAAPSSVYSDEDSEGYQNPEGRGQPGSSSTINAVNNDVELDNFQDRFHSLVSQITQEMEQGLELVRPDTLQPSSQQPEALPEASPLPNILPAVDEFGWPYPPDERVSILNGYVRRMPTIESMGSREAGSVAAPSLYTNGDTATISLKSPPVSRPPTRTDTLTSDHSANSRPPSRNHGMNMVAGDIKANEVGELVIRNEGSDRAESLISTGSSQPSTRTYHTAKSHGSIATSDSTGGL